jgi:hypothetical protein
MIKSQEMITSISIEFRPKWSVNNKKLNGEQPLYRVGNARKREREQAE